MTVSLIPGLLSLSLDGIVAVLSDRSHSNQGVGRESGHARRRGTSCRVLLQGFRKGSLVLLKCGCGSKDVISQSPLDFRMSNLYGVSTDYYFILFVVKFTHKPVISFISFRGLQISFSVDSSSRDLDVSGRDLPSS